MVNYNQVIIVESDPIKRLYSANKWNSYGLYLNSLPLILNLLVLMKVNLILFI